MDPQQSQNDPLPETSEIQRLDPDTVRRITAEQAVSDLSSIVKELMDNALDAESTTIKIRLFGQGLDIIEVSDDGNGVPKGSLPYMAVRHATSKIESLDDIYTGTGLTMGFRGEALFATACVSDSLVVASRTEDDELATKLVFGNDALPEQQQKELARKVGTTVAVVKPFGSLPARRADLVRRIKQERTKIFKLVEAYGIFNVGVGFRLMDIHNNREEVGLATSSSSKSLKETASSLLGSAFVKSTQSFAVCLESFFKKTNKASNNNNNNSNNDVSDDNYDGICYNWGIKGLISVPPARAAASETTIKQQRRERLQQNKKQQTTKPRTVQYYSINGRIVDLPKVSALLKKLWTSLGGTKKPCALLEFTMPNNAFDINLSPDKKTVLWTHEAELLSLLEDKIREVWSDASSNVFVDGNRGNALFQYDENDGVAHKNDDGDGDHHEYKRRFAFVHDITKAKMQHEMARRQKSDDHDNENRRPSACTADDDDDDEEEEQPAAAAEAAPVNLQQTKLTLEPKRPRIPPNSDDDDDNNHHSDARVSRKKAKRVQDASTTPTETETKEDIAEPEDEPMEAKRPKKPITPTTVTEEPLRLSDSDRKKWNEIQSKFRQKEPDDDDPPVVPVSRSISTGSRSTVPTPEESPETVVEATHRVSAVSSSSSLSTSSRRPNINLQQFAHPKAGATTRTKTVPQEENTSPTPPPPSQETPRTDDSNNSSGMSTDGRMSTDDSNSKPNSTIESSKDTSNDKDKLEQDVVWGSFLSTEEICLRARFERLNMRKRKQQIDRVRRMVRQKGSKPEDDDDDDDNKETTAMIRDSDDDSSLIRMSKSTFRDGMEVIGQFNLGFILAKCSKNHLWILDQHACDEKYNFERFCKTTVLHEQPLISPLPLELSPSEEACVLDHMDIFEANGFRFRVNHEAPIRHRLSLTSLPHSGAQEGRKAVQFGPNDVSALCAILTEGSSYDPGAGGTGTDGSGLYGNNAVRIHASSSSRNNSNNNDADRLLARLPKAIAMFASRACRTSIMIGTALSQTEMTTVVQKLSEVDMPWNCPHGRPTMKHVANVLPILLKDERSANEHIAVPHIVPMAQGND